MSSTFARIHLIVLLTGFTSLCSLAAREPMPPVHVSPVFISDKVAAAVAPVTRTISDVRVSSFTSELQAPPVPEPTPLFDVPTPLPMDTSEWIVTLEAKEMVCETDCCDSDCCCDGSGSDCGGRGCGGRGCGGRGCGCRGGCLGNDTRCQMHLHYPYYPAMHGYYYFRPYHPRHVREQQGVAAMWGEDPRVPYANAVFQRVYAQYQQEH